MHVIFRSLVSEIYVAIYRNLDDQRHNQYTFQYYTKNVVCKLQGGAHDVSAIGVPHVVYHICVVRRHSA